MENSIAAARERLLATVRSGDWERVPHEADAYGAAVRADERRRALDDVAEAISSVFGSNPDEPAREWRDRCLRAIDALR